jgi:hypothetical protein
VRRIALLLASTALAVLLASEVVWAEDFRVRNLNDAGRGSLRAAMAAAYATPASQGGDVITFAPDLRGRILLKSPLPSLRGRVEIRGPGARAVVVRRAVAERFSIFHVAMNGNVTVSGLTISNGYANQRSEDEAGGPEGGGIGGDFGYALTVRDAAFVGNRAVGTGGAIDTQGDLIVERSTFTGNSAHLGGGAIYHHGFNTLRVVGSTFSGNEAGGSGGAIDYLSDRGAAISSSTFSANKAAADGGAVHQVGGRLTIWASTLSANRAGRTGGGIYSSVTSETSMRTSIVAGNVAPQSPDIYATLSSGGYNLVGNTRGTQGLVATDLRNVDAGLDPEGLKDNGGPTQTIALMQGSPAVDAVEEGCPPPATDQRGVSRPQDGDGEGEALCDIGAYELESQAP